MPRLERRPSSRAAAWLAAACLLAAQVAADTSTDTTTITTITTTVRTVSFGEILAKCDNTGAYTCCSYAKDYASKSWCSVQVGNLGVLAYGILLGQADRMGKNLFPTCPASSRWPRRCEQPQQQDQDCYMSHGGYSCTLHENGTVRKPPPPPPTTRDRKIHSRGRIESQT